MGRIRGKRTEGEAPTSSGRPPPVGPGTDKVLQSLLDELDKYTPGSAKARREQVRFPFANPSVRLTLFQPGGSANTCTVSTRNLSRTGVGLLHRAYVHPKSRCLVDMPTLDGATYPVQGTIVRCTHVHGLVHELGILFDQPVNLQRFVTLDTLLGPFILEQLDLSTLKGSVVCVLPDELDRRMVQLYVSGTGLSTQIAGSLEEWRQIEVGAPDVAAIDVATPGLAEDLAALSMLISEARLIAIGDVESLDQFRSLELQQDTICLRRPLLQTNLLAAIAESVADARAGVAAGAQSKHLPNTIATQALEEMRRAAGELREAIENSDPGRCHSICQHMWILGEHTGSGRIQRAAEAAKVKLAATMSPDESRAELEDLLRACGQREAA